MQFCFMVLWSIWHQTSNTLMNLLEECRNTFLTNQSKVIRQTMSRILKMSKKWHGDLSLPYMSPTRINLLLIRIIFLLSIRLRLSLACKLSKRWAPKKVGILTSWQLSLFCLYLFWQSPLRKLLKFQNFSRKIQITKEKNHMFKYHLLILILLRKLWRLRKYSQIFKMKKKIENIQKIISSNGKTKPWLNITTKGPSQKQVIVIINSENANNFIKKSST